MLTKKYIDPKSTLDYKETTMSKKYKWIDVGSDINWEEYGGIWGIQINDHEFYFVRFDNRDEMDSGMQYQYYVDVKYVDLRELSEKLLTSVRDSCGISKDASSIELATACAQYGAAAPLKDFAGDKYPSRLRALAKRFAEQCTRDPELKVSLLGRPVNMMGTSAFNYMCGNFFNSPNFN